MNELRNYVDIDLLREEIDLGNVTVRPHEADETLRILNYSNLVQVTGRWNAVTTRTRGLMVRVTDDRWEDATVVAKPWKKFFTLDQMESGWALGDEENETSATDVMDQLDFDGPAEIMDKSDGSLGIFYMAPDGLPAVATRGSFGSEQAVLFTKLLRDDAALREWVVTMLQDPRLVGGAICAELVGPSNPIVLTYERDEFVLLGGVDADGAYLSPNDSLFADWPNRRVETFQGSTLREALAMPPRENAEGLVVRLTLVDGEETFVKIKQEDYKRMHQVIFNTTPKRVLELAMEGGIEDVLRELPMRYKLKVAAQYADLIGMHDGLIRAAEAFVDTLDVDNLDMRVVGPLVSQLRFGALVFVMIRGADAKRIDETAWKIVRNQL